MKRLIGFTVLLLALIAVRQAGAAEVCRPEQMHVGSQFSDRENAHGEMCLATAHILTRLVQESGLPCNSVVGEIMYPDKHNYFVTCLVVNMRLGTPASRVQTYYNYMSIAGAPFQIQP